MHDEYRLLVSTALDERRRGRVHVARVARRRRGGLDDRTRDRTCSSRNLPEWSLCVVSHPGDSLGILADEPGPEWARYLWERAVGHVLPRKRVLAHAGSHGSRVGADAGYGSGLWFCCDRFR